MVEHLTFNQTVVGSNLATLISMNNAQYWQITTLSEKKLTTSRASFLWYVKILLGGTAQLLNFTSANASLWGLLYTQKTRSVGWITRGIGSRNSPLSRVHSRRVGNPTTSIKKNLKIQLNSHQHLWPFFLQSWSTFRPKGNPMYSTNRNFRLFFLAGSPEKSHATLISSKRYFARWLDSYNLMFNLFYVDPNVQLLTNKTFIEEALVFNWHLSVKDYKLFRFLQPFFSFKDVTHGATIHSSIFLVLLQKLDFTILVDLRNHKKMLQYLRSYSMYTVGLVPINYSPWQVSYPIPTFADSNISQYYFLRWLFHIKVQSSSSRYSLHLSNWNSLHR